MARSLLSGPTMNVRQMARAGLGGVAATTVDVTVLVHLVRHGAPVAIAAFLGAACGACVCFTMNKYLAFRDGRPVTFAQLARFAMVATGTASLMALSMQLFVVGLGVPYLVAKAICAVLVFLAWTYPAQRRIVFSPSPLRVPS
jgi:putative flippase GtrA